MQITVTVAPDGALFVSIPIRVRVGEPELRMMIADGRWAACWCGRRVAGGAIARA